MTQKCPQCLQVISLDDSVRVSGSRVVHLDCQRPRHLTREERTHFCPRCRTDLTESIRGHLYGCVTLPAEIRQRAQEARDAARRLVKESQQLTDHADVLMREAEAAVAALRETMQRTAQRDLGG